MMSLQIESNPEVESVFDKYPDAVRDKLLDLRRLIIEAADEAEAIEHIEETLKWGEPSYLAKNGSTIRIDWKKDKPDQYAIYFKCTHTNRHHQRPRRNAARIYFYRARSRATLEAWRVCLL